jgi:hypothetical protein
MKTDISAVRLNVESVTQSAEPLRSYGSARRLLWL